MICEYCGDEMLDTSGSLPQHSCLTCGAVVSSYDLDNNGVPLTYLKSYPPKRPEAILQRYSRMRSCIDIISAFQTGGIDEAMKKYEFYLERGTK